MAMVSICLHLSAFAENIALALTVLWTTMALTISKREKQGIADHCRLYKNCTEDNMPEVFEDPAICSAREASIR